MIDSEIVWPTNNVNVLKSTKGRFKGACPLIHPNCFSVYLGLGLGLIQ